MFEFKIIKELKHNLKIIELIKDFTCKTKKGKSEIIFNLLFIHIN